MSKNPKNNQAFLDEAYFPKIHLVNKGGMSGKQRRGVFRPPSAQYKPADLYF